MARKQDSYPAPIQGVSTLAPRNRARGQAGLQVNLRSDPVAKLTRRPSLSWNKFLLKDHRVTSHHSYYRAGKEVQLIINSIGQVFAFINGDSVPVMGTMSNYAKDNDLIMETINDTTFVVNRAIRPRMSTKTDEATAVIASHVNVVSALSYSTTLTVSITIPGASIPTVEVKITIADGIDNMPAADKARATNAVARKIYDEVRIHSEYGAQTLGSSVAIWSKSSGHREVEIKITSGRSNSVIAINSKIEKVDGLPLYARRGTIITVQPDPSSEKGIYYLKAVGLKGEIDKSFGEVVWTEARAYDEPYKLDGNTMPHFIVYDAQQHHFAVNPRGGTIWEDRRTGNNISCPVPDFVNHLVQAVGYFQKRLVIISGNTVSMTKTGNLYNWWKSSAIKLLVTDPIGVSSNSTGIDVLRYLIEHNRDLLIIASNGQFKITGTVGITPETVAMPLTTSQEIQVSVPPVPLGTAIYLPINYGESTGITRYDGLRDQQDIATPITQHVIGYMKGEAKLLVGSPNLEMLALTTSDSKPNEIFIYEQFTQDGKILQQSWSTWTLPKNNEILALTFRRDKLSVTVRINDDIYLKSFNMYSRIAIDTHEVFLDDFLTLPTDGRTIQLPKFYTTEKLIVVMGKGTIYPLEEIKFNKVGDTITFVEDIGKGFVYVGTKFKSAYRPTRPFREDDKGIAITTDRVRISTFILNVVDTESVLMHIDSPYYSGDDQENSPRILNRSSNRVGIVDLFTGDYKFSFSQDANLAEAEFYTEGFLGMTVAGISWEGQYNTPGRRLQ